MFLPHSLGFFFSCPGHLKYWLCYLQCVRDLRDQINLFSYGIPRSIPKRGRQSGKESGDARPSCYILSAHAKHLSLVTVLCFLIVLCPLPSPLSDTTSYWRTRPFCLHSAEYQDNNKRRHTVEDATQTHVELKAKRMDTWDADHKPEDRQILYTDLPPSARKRWQLGR